MATRRQFLSSSAAAFLTQPLTRAWSSSSSQHDRPRVAFLGTVVHEHSHSQHFLDRLCEGYSWRGGWQLPRLEVASVFIDQFPSNDLGRNRIERYGLKQFGSVAEALTLGGSRLAVDGVVIIAEHGDYERTATNQVRYPRYAWFKEAVRVFEQFGRSVPIFNDKHLSTSWDECLEMVADSKRLNFPFLAGSSLPVTVRSPSIDLPHGSDLKESVCVAYGGIDSYDFHAYETAQCMSERRRGSESGIKSAQLLTGEPLWQLMETDGRKATRELFIAALNRSHNLPVEGGYPTAVVDWDWAKHVLSGTTGIFFEHVDGFRTSAYLTNIRDFNYAGMLASGEVLSCQMYLPMPGHGSTTADFFNPLTRHIEDMILTGRAAYPVERTLLTSGMVIAGVDSQILGGKIVETPEMNVAYSVPDESWYWRD